MINITNYIWLFGENLAKTANDNSYYLWKHIVNINDNIEKYLILEKNESTLKAYNSLSKHAKKFVIWKNSLKHHEKFFDADLFFVSQTYKDITPDRILFKKMNLELKKPVMHLQNGVCGIKKIDETGKSYGNNILRFLTYNKELKNKLIEKNDFKDYQILYAPYQPKYGELLKKSEVNETNQILWFLSERKYLKEDLNYSNFLSLIIKKVTDNETFKNYLKENNLSLKICVSSHLDKQIYNNLSEDMDNNLIKITNQQDCDIIEEISKSKLLISDYSSIVYDFSFIKRPYILFQPDINRFKENDEAFYDENELKFAITQPNELISNIIEENYKPEDYIEKAFPDEKDFNQVKQNKHLDELYSYFKELQDNQITFIGYHFYGIGGTVNATMALAESLLQEGYFINIISMKKTTKLQHEPPYGLNIQYLFWNESKSIREKLLRLTHKSEKYYSYFKYDSESKFIHPYACYALTKLMKKIKSKTVVSTRESIHLFLNDCDNENVKNKIFFYHTLADVLADAYPGLMNELNKITIDKAIFITEQNRLAIKEMFNYTNYNHYINLGNTLLQSKVISKDEISSIPKKDTYSGIYLLRINKDRAKDIDNLIEFGKYVKNNNINYIELDVYGSGNYVDEFIDLIETNNLTDIIHYKLSTEEPIKEIRNHDLMIDFSLNHSFGMTYLEAILNGKKVYCMKNPGSIEVMENIPDSYIQSYEGLCERIKDLDKVTTAELKENYDIINEKYSQKVISKKFLDFLK